MPRELNAFVPAAGIGERLLPITADIPKPLLPVLGHSLLSRTLERLSAAAVARIGVNLHHKSDVIASWLEASPYQDSVVCFEEPALLGTGGALRNARCLLEQSPFIVHNSDILTDIDLGALVKAHESLGNIVTLALHDCPAYNKVAVDNVGRVVSVGSIKTGAGVEKVLAFTGIAVYDPAFLEFFPGGPSSAVDGWIAAMAAGREVGSVDVTGHLWHDIGTPASYAAAIVDMLRRDGEWIYVADDITAHKVDLDGFVAIEAGCRFDDGVALRNCVVLPNTHIVRDSRHENRLVGNGYAVALAESEFLGLTHGEHGMRIGVGGSGRQYFRARSAYATAVHMVCQPDEPDFERHIEYSRFFARHGVPVPELLRFDPAAKQAQFEDLGDLSLYNYFRFPRFPEDIEAVYPLVLDSLVTLHVEASIHVRKCELLSERLFDFEYFRWETGYFLEHFVNGLYGQHPVSSEALECDFDRLARQADALPKCIIHRDFQSQNIMFARGLPRFIDYQGARMGPGAYDLAAVLWDPYHRLDDTMRARLVDYYVAQRSRRAEGDFSAQSFIESLGICRLQRHMQALGAYGFLSATKGKLHFRKHIPEGLRLLKLDTDDTAEAFPAIATLVEALYASPPAPSTILA